MYGETLADGRGLGAEGSAAQTGEVNTYPNYVSEVAEFQAPEHTARAAYGNVVSRELLHERSSR